MDRILVIRLGAVGDFALSFGPFAAIRHHHMQDHITLLTTALFKDLAEESPWFDEIQIDRRPKWWQVGKMATLRKQLAGFDFVYDLQTSSRSSLYHTLAGKPRWSGIAKGSSHLHANPNRNFLHTLDRQRDQLEYAGITCFPEPDLDWLKERHTYHLVPDQPFALFVPGAALHRPAKRWPIENFAAVAAWGYQHHDIIPVVIGAAQDRECATIIKRHCPQTIDLTGKTSLADIAALAAKACFALGNDTGPMHFAAVIGCACVVLFSRESNPILTAPRGVYNGQVSVLEEPDLSDLALERVQGAIVPFLH